jgi:hypothetical protein
MGLEHNGVPKTPLEEAKSHARLTIAPLMASMLGLGLGTLGRGGVPSVAAAEGGPYKIYIDKVNRFALSVRPSWITMPRKAQTPEVMKYQVCTVYYVLGTMYYPTPTPYPHTYPQQPSPPLPLPLPLPLLLPHTPHPYPHTPYLYIG